MCFDLESEQVTSECMIDKTDIIETGSQCLYFIAGTKLGKIAVPDMVESFMVESGHSGPIIDMTISQQ